MMFSCSGMLVSLDLQSAAMVKQPPMIPITSSPRPTLCPLGDERVLAIAGTRNPPSTELILIEARTLTTMARVQMDAYVRTPVLLPGGREILLIEHGDDLAKTPQPSRLPYFDTNSGTPTRTISLEAPFPTTRVSADGRFVYASNMDRNRKNQTPRELRILAAETGELLETIKLLEHASWLVRGSGEPAWTVIEDRRLREPGLSSLLVLDGGRVIARLPIHNFVYQLHVDQESGRMYLLDGRSFAEYTWPSLQLQKQVSVGRIVDWGGQPSDRPSVSVAPGATRALVVAGGSAVALDLDAGNALPVAKLGSSGARARKFWADFGAMTLTMFTGSGASPTSPALSSRSLSDPVPVAFSADGRMAMLPAPTGEIAMIDMTSAQCPSGQASGEWPPSAFFAPSRRPRSSAGSPTTRPASRDLLNHYHRKG